MKFMIKTSLLLALVIFAAGCFTTRVNFTSPNAGTPSHIYNGNWHHGIVYGLVELSSPVPINEVCGSGQVTFVEQKTSFLNGVAAMFTWNLYTPQSMTVFCSGGSAAEVLFTEEGALAYMPFEVVPD